MNRHQKSLLKKLRKSQTEAFLCFQVLQMMSIEKLNSITKQFDDDACGFFSFSSKRELALLNFPKIL